DLAALDAAAHPRRPDDDHVLEVSRAGRVREPARDGRVDGRVPGRARAGALGPVGARARADHRLPLPRALSPPPRGTTSRRPELQPALRHAGPGAFLMGFGAYLRNIKDAAVTIAEGLAVTASHLVRKPYTVQYPDRLPDGLRVQDTLP